MIALYEREAMKNGTTGFYETISVAAEKVYDTLPRAFTKRLGLLCFSPCESRSQYLVSFL